MWTWDPEKALANSRKHGVPFEVAKLIFDDPAHLSRPDEHPDDNRWQTIGQIETNILLVIHTEPEFDADLDIEVGRIISARKATPRERRAYVQTTFN